MRISCSKKKALIEKAKKLIEEPSNIHASGIASKFIKLCKDWGVKFTEKDAEYMTKTYTRQRRAFRLYIGPFCFGIFKHNFEKTNKLGGKEIWTVYGYITQIIEVVSDVYGMFYTNEVPEEFQYAVDSLISQCKKYLGFDFWDYHAQNLGFMDGQLVIIDWGNE